LRRAKLCGFGVWKCAKTQSLALRQTASLEDYVWTSKDLLSKILR